jgi:hypothetical protein
MSLKAFHLFFIAVSIVLAAFVAAWAAGQYRTAHEASYLMTAGVFAAFGGALIMYATKFQRKARRL